MQDMTDFAMAFAISHGSQAWSTFHWINTVRGTIKYFGIGASFISVKNNSICAISYR